MRILEFQRRKKMLNYYEGMTTYPEPEPLPETQKLFLQCMENFIRERQQEAVKIFWKEIEDCLDLPITEESAVIVLDKKKVGQVLKKRTENCISEVTKYDMSKAIEFMFGR